MALNQPRHSITKIQLKPAGCDIKSFLIFLALQICQGTNGVEFYSLVSLMCRLSYHVTFWKGSLAFIKQWKCTVSSNMH